MRILKKSIGAKISLLYLLLAIINMSFFTIVIYENQIELITENTRYKIKDITGELINTIDRTLKENSAREKISGNNGNLIDDISSLISGASPRYAIYTEKGKIIRKGKDNFQIDNRDILFGVRALTNMEFTGKRYYSFIDEKSMDLSFYIPLVLKNTGQSIILVKFSAKEMSGRLNRLYRLMTIIISIISLFHLFFALLLFRMIINPIKALHRSSVEITRGNFDARPHINRNDEIGELSAAFNQMADSVQEKIYRLEKQHKIMEDELEMASKVQEVIFPHIKDVQHFNFAVYNRAAEKVSGDYYDIFDIGDSKYGFLIVDVQGHGVPAAMITMLIKEKFRQNSELYNDPAELFKKVNMEVSQVLKEGDLDSGMFFTAFYMTIDKNNVLESVDAGHLRPFHLSKSHHRISLLKSGGIPMGISTDMDELYTTQKLNVAKGDKILLFTDGIIEARNESGCEFGINGLIEVLKKNHSKNPDELLREIIMNFSLFTDIENLKDDATVLIIEVK